MWLMSIFWVDFYYCSAVSRVTPSDPNSRPSLCLTNYVLSGITLSLIYWALNLIIYNCWSPVGRSSISIRESDVRTGRTVVLELPSLASSSSASSGAHASGQQQHSTWAARSVAFILRAVAGDIYMCTVPCGPDGGSFPSPLAFLAPSEVPPLSLASAARLTLAGLNGLAPGSRCDYRYEVGFTGFYYTYTTYEYSYVWIL